METQKQKCVRNNLFVAFDTHSESFCQKQQDNHFGQVDESNFIDCQYAVARIDTVYCFALAMRNKPESPCPYIHKSSKAHCPFNGPVSWEVQKK